MEQNQTIIGPFESQMFFYWLTGSHEPGRHRGKLNPLDTVDVQTRTVTYSSSLHEFIPEV